MKIRIEYEMRMGKQVPKMEKFRGAGNESICVETY